jgi:ADP-ribose pyrophosphatase YjhB (NUDIX family)
MAEDLGIDMAGVRMNAETPNRPHNDKHTGRFNPECPGCVDEKAAAAQDRLTHSRTPGGQKYNTARALIKQNDGTVITARQKDGRSLLPGGHLENGETPEAAVTRELQEEMGLDIRQALTGETYDFEGEGLHRVFVVDGSKLDLSKLQPGDDVEEAEIFNSPFTDSHGVQHPGGAKADAGQAAMLAEGVEHVAEDIQEGVEADPSRDAELMHDLAERTACTTPTSAPPASRSAVWHPLPRPLRTLPSRTSAPSADTRSRRGRLSASRTRT